jgi:subtilisin family serine protease
MGCGSSKATGKDEFFIPSVTRAAAKSLKNCDDDDELPLGILLTGGRKLRKDGFDGTGIKVAVIDSGIDENHPGFDGKVTRKVWYRDGTPLKEDDHGTHVAGTIHLMAPQADIYDYRVFGRKGSVGVTEAIAQAIRAAADVECQLINMSLGGPVANPEIKSAVEYAAAKGVIMVCAAGNEGDNNPLTNEIRYCIHAEFCLLSLCLSKASILVEYWFHTTKNSRSSCF